MSAAAILLAIEQAAVAARRAGAFLQKLRGDAVAPPDGSAPLVTEADVEAAATRGLTAADSLDATSDAALDRLRREGKIT